MPLSVIDDYQRLPKIIGVYTTNVIAINYVNELLSLLYLIYTTTIQYCLKIKINGFQTFFWWKRESYLFRFWRKRGMVETANIILAEMGNYHRNNKINLH